MTVLGVCLVALPLVLGIYAYAAYPALLTLLARLVRSRALPAGDPAEWPTVSISLPVYNEEEVVRGTLEALLDLDYPRDRLQVLVVSDASSDGTDAIVLEFADRGVELLRLPERGGKTAAENAAVPHLRGEIIVNTDATTRILPEALKPLLRVFQDDTIGVASGRDVSVGAQGSERNVGETGYVGYEMAVRDLETRFGSIVGASGCFYAIRRELHDRPVPLRASRDFAAALAGREARLRSVSVPSAVCMVPRAGSIEAELRRKRRTMAQGLETLWLHRALLDPFRYGRFAFMLFSHKLCRWLVPPAGVLALPGCALLVAGGGPLGTLGWAGLAAIAAGAMSMEWSERGRAPRAVRLAGYAFAGLRAGVQAWRLALGGDQTLTWEPTRREHVPRD